MRQNKNYSSILQSFSFEQPKLITFTFRYRPAYSNHIFIM